MLRRLITHGLVAAGLLVAAPALASGTASPKPPAPPAVDLSTLPPGAIATPPPAGEQKHPVVVHLLSDKASVAPGSTVRVGAYLKQQPGWHTYWKTPGEIGKPTEIAWALPDGFTAAPYQYPVPQRFELEGIVSFGYDDQVLVFSNIAVPADAAAGPHPVTAKVDWLVCEVQCIPGEVELAGTITVGDDAPSAYAGLFDHFAAQHPVPLTSVAQFAVESAASHTALTKNSPFRVAFKLTQTGTDKISLATEQGSWPGFTPILKGIDWFVQEKDAKLVQVDDGVVVVIEGETFEPEGGLPQPYTAGGLFRVDVGGTPIWTEYTTTLPWAESSTEVASPLFALAQGGADAGPGDGPQVASTGASGPVPTANAPVSPLWMMLMAFGGGLLLNIMPCVLPVLTLKLYGLVENQHLGAAGRQRAGLLYTAGVLASMLVLAAVVIALQLAFGTQVGWGFQFQYPAYVAGLATVVFVFGLSLFGVFELPAIGVDAASAAQAKSGTAEHFFTGVFAVLVGTPCSAPFLGPAMGFAFSQPAYMVALFFAIVGLGLAAPFLLVAFVPALFKVLPKPGEWMDVFKQLLGFTLIGTTVWLVDVLGAQVGADRATGFLAFLCFVAAGAWVYGKWGSITETTGRQATALGSGLLIAAVGGWMYLDFELDDAKNCDAGEVITDLDFSEGIPWQPFTEQRLAALSDKPVFVDFTAEWCLTCKVNERTVLASTTVSEALRDKGVVPLKADWTNRDPYITEWLQRFGRAGVPFYVAIPPNGGDPIPLPEVITPSMVVDALDRITKG